MAHYTGGLDPDRIRICICIPNPFHTPFHTNIIDDIWLAPLSSSI